MVKTSQKNWLKKPRNSQPPLQYPAAVVSCFWPECHHQTRIKRGQIAPCLRLAIAHLTHTPTPSDVNLELQNKWELQTRHHVGHIVSFHQKEAFCFSPLGRWALVRPRQGALVVRALRGTDRLVSRQRAYERRNVYKPQTNGVNART